MRANYYFVLTFLVISFLLSGCKKEKDDAEPQVQNTEQISHFPLSSGDYWFYDYSENSTYYEEIASNNYSDNNTEYYSDDYQEFLFVLDPIKKTFSSGESWVSPIGTIYNDEYNYDPKNEYELSDFEDLEYYEITSDGMYGRALETEGELLEMNDYLMIKKPIEVGLEWTSKPDFDVDWLFTEENYYTYSNIKSDVIVNSKYVETIEVTYNNSTYEAIVLLENSTWQASADINLNDGGSGTYSMQEIYTTKYYLIDNIGIFKDESQWENDFIFHVSDSDEYYNFESEESGNSTTQLTEHNSSQKSEQKLDGMYIPAIFKSKFNAKHKREIKAKMNKHLQQFSK